MIWAMGLDAGRSQEIYPPKKPPSCSQYMFSTCLPLSKPAWPIHGWPFGDSPDDMC